MGKKDTVTFEEFKEEIELTDKQYGQEEDLYFLVNKIIRSTLPDNMTVRDVHKLQKPPESEDFQGRKHFIAYGQAPDFVILDKEFDQSKEDQEKNVYGCVEIKKFKKVSKKSEDDVNDTIKAINEKHGEKIVIIKTIDIVDKNDNVDKNNKKEIINYSMRVGNEDINNKSILSELIRECIFFKKVLFTNLKQWYFLEYDGDIEKEENVEKNIVSYTISMSKIKIKKLYNYSEDVSERLGKVRFAILLSELDDIKWK